MELGPARVRAPVPGRSRDAAAGGGQRGPQPAGVQHAHAGGPRRGRALLSPGARDRLRAALLRLRAGAGRGRVRVPGLQMTRAGLPPWLARSLACWAAAVAFGVGACALAATLARTLPHPHPLEELSYYPSGERLGLATLGHRETFADLAWMRAVQYYGEHRRTDMVFTRLYHVF